MDYLFVNMHTIYINFHYIDIGDNMSLKERIKICLILDKVDGCLSGIFLKIFYIERAMIGVRRKLVSLYTPRIKFLCNI